MSWLEGKRFSLVWEQHLWVFQRINLLQPDMETVSLALRIFFFIFRSKEQAVRRDLEEVVDSCLLFVVSYEEGKRQLSTRLEINCLLKQFHNVKV